MTARVIDRAATVTDRVRRLPEALLALFGIVVFAWMGLQEVTLLMVVPLSVAILALLHLGAPKHPTTPVGLAIAYLVGGAIAGVLLFGIAIAPIGGTPTAVEAYIRVAIPMIGLYLTALVALVVKLP